MAGVPVRLPQSLRPRYPIRGDRLLLRPLTSRDIDAVLAYRGREDVCRYVPFKPMTAEGIAERLAGPWARTELTAEGQSLSLGAEVRQTGELAGDCVLFWHSSEHAGGEVGYVFNPGLAGRGYATEAVTMMLRLGFEELDLHRITARIDERNEPPVLEHRRSARRLAAGPGRRAAGPPGGHAAGGPPGRERALQGRVVYRA
jgi:RimJ/RimL family protein N-acetyltransferase